MDRLDELLHLGRATFDDAFRADNRKEDFDYYMGRAFNREALVKQFINPLSAFYIAEKGQREMIGYLKINVLVPNTSIDDHSLEIERIYVLKEYQGQGIGKKLMNRAFEIALERRVDYIWLGVWEKNHNAIRFYEKLGFEIFGTRPFQLGQDNQTDFLMKCKDYKQ